MTTKILRPLGDHTYFDELCHLIGADIVDLGHGEMLHFVDGVLFYGPIGGRKADLVSFDLCKEWNSHQGKNYSLKKEPLARALGVKGDGSITVVDATCGTGKDSILLLKFGARVIAHERNPIIGALFFDALKRAEKNNDKFSELLKDRFQFSFGDSSLESCLECDAIYIDPMYPHKKKKALPRKEMQIFRAVVGSDLDSAKLLDWARGLGVKRIVVKRPNHAEHLGDAPSHSYHGKSTRYDLYL
ncbi:MAG: class I SAM-dependent methyltransferase [Bacteriovoracaceae bacterium]|nr:class I SAM-dependent methyltransferase [Bacteriovoracaceae bacterium]